MDKGLSTQCERNMCWQYKLFCVWNGKYVWNMYRKISENRIINSFHFLPWTTRIKAERTQSDFRNMVKPHFYAQIHLIYLFRKTNFNVVLKIFQNQIFTLMTVSVRLLSVNWVLSHLTNWEPEEEQVKRARAVVHIRRSVFLLLPGAAAGGI